MINYTNGFGGQNAVKKIIKVKKNHDKLWMEFHIQIVFFNDFTHGFYGISLI